ncbi:MAG: uncharacterized protein JWL69_1659 [Phycisphaerales bacterium]|nr:uncharacterized protein [Phycisphaerales bacterium]MDB5356844.1 uncharacterized protein [Phycisphaerales bacterium]
MRLANTAWLRELVDPHFPPCVSIHMPMQRAKPPAAENPRLYRDLVDKAESLLASDYRSRITRPIVEKLRSIAADDHFWIGDRDGLAVFASPDLLRVIDLPKPVRPAVHVADNFNVKPLLRILQSDEHYHVLALTQRQAQMYEGAGDMKLTPLDSQTLPQDPGVVSKMRLTHQLSATEDLHTPPTQFPDEGTVPAPASLDAFFRAVDKAVWENFSRDTKLPLILCAVEHYHPQFHAISNNPQLLPDGIRHDPQSLGTGRLRQEAWSIIEPRLRARMESATDRFRAAKAHHRGSDEPVEAVEAAMAGRVDTLLIDASKEIPARFDPLTGRIASPTPVDPHADDLLDDLAETVLKADGEVLVLPPEMMPTDHGLAAIYRY